MKYFALKSRRINILLALAIAIAGLVSGCDTPDETPSYEPQYFGPISDTRLNIEDISQLEDIILTQEVSPTDINNNFQGTRNVPAFNLDQPIGPYQLNITDIFELIRVDTFIFETRIENTLPIPMDAGTELVFRNQNNDSVVYKKVLQEDVPPGEKITINETLTDKEVENDIDFYLENFTTSGSDGAVTFDNSDQAFFEFEIVFLDINELIISKGQSYRIKDTSNVSYSEPANPDSSVAGEIYISINNLFPIDFKLNLNFIDDKNGVVIDSFLTEKIELDGAPVNAQGRVIGDTTRVSDTVQITRGQLSALKKADRVATNFRAISLTEDFQGNPISNTVIEIEDQSAARLLIGTDAKIFVE
jgi:hypothetical protein